ncbi:MAG: AmmeMemoRadiSam system protein B [Candidatus Thermoplasmatota archaeon]|nr:AmmeMemoRadiSam system protein B [Candidatus Thermoplasmatota archaeon]
MREPAVAGQFYPASKRKLKRNIEKSFKHPLGPGEMPVLPDIGTGNVLGGVFPHAGYMFSGPIAAHSVSAFINSGIPDVLVVIGPNHSGRGREIALSDEDFITPLGIVEHDEDVGLFFQESDIPVDNLAHRYEHSLEVQLPFFQYFDKTVKIVAISMGAQNLENAIKVANGIKRAIREYPGKIGIVASSDFTHCGFSYGKPIPPGMTAGEYARKEDKRAIDRILKLDGPGLIETVRKFSISMCGFGPVSSMIMGLEGKARNAKMLKYASSYDIMPGGSAVGYGSIILTK